MTPSIINSGDNRIPKGWISGTDTKKSLEFARSSGRYSAFYIIGRTKVADRCAELLGVHRRDIWIQIQNTPYFHPALNCVYIQCCLLKKEDHSLSNVPEHRLQEWLSPYSSQFPNRKVTKGSQSRPVAIQAKSETLQDPMPDPVEMLPPLRTVEEVASPELTFEMLNEMLKRVGQHEPVIDFDLAWPAWGYGLRDNALKSWKARCYVEGKDWSPEVGDTFRADSRKVGEGMGRPKESIYLTIHCFKRFCVHAGTKRASEYLDYLIEAEEELYKLKQSQPDPTPLPAQTDPGLSQFDVMIQLIQEQREQHLFRRNQEMLNQQTQQHIQRLESQNKRILETQQKASEDLSLLPQEQLNLDDQRYWTNLVTQRINDYCAATGVTHHEARKRFNQYAQVQLRVNLRTRQNHGFKGNLMDLIREDGLGQKAYAVACELFVVPTNRKGIAD